MWPRFLCDRITPQLVATLWNNLQKINTLQGRPTCVLAEKSLSDTAGACDIWEWIRRTDMSSSSGSQFTDAEVGPSVYDYDGAVILEASPKQMALDKKEPHLPMKLLGGFKKTNAKCGLWPQFLGKKQCFKNGERTLRPLWNVSTCNKKKKNEWIWQGSVQCVHFSS